MRRQPTLSLSLSLSFSLSFSLSPMKKCLLVGKKERKLQANLPDEHKCKNPQQNTSKLNSTAHQKDHTLWQGEIYPWDARMIEHMKINKHSTPH